MSWFSKSSISTVILTFRSALVPYYINIVFFIVDTKEGGRANIPIRVKEQINAVYFNNEYSLLTFKVKIPSIVNTLNKIIIPRDVFNIRKVIL